jgi:hypothetical protein
MPEGSRSAAILIATSWQALGRATRGGQDTRISDCSVMILFAGIYIEATLDYIVAKMKKKHQMIKFLGGKEYPGMQDKLGWYYNEFVAKSRAANKKQLYAVGIKRKLRRKLPGFAKLYKFRNDLSHGVINSSAKSVQDAQKLRNHAKAIVAELYEIAASAGYDVPRVTTYQQAIAV